MPFTIDIQNEHDYAIDSARLQHAAMTVLSQHDVDANSSISVVINTNDAVQALNQQFRGVDAPTDVLSFPAEPLPPDLQADDSEAYLGDLVIAYAYAKAQAEREGHPLADSFALLVVHGTLHLLGYDHDTPDNRAEMWAAQAQALRALNIDESLVPALENMD